MYLPYMCIIIIIIIAILPQNAINSLQRHTSSLISETSGVLQLPHIYSKSISVKPHHYDTKQCWECTRAVRMPIFTQHLSMLSSEVFLCCVRSDR